MFNIQSTQLAAALVATGFLALSLGARAESGAQSKDAAACKSAQMSAWFERQRQLTDGDANPFQAIPNARECRAMQAANDTAPAKQAVVVAAAPRQSFPSGYEGVKLGGR